MNSKAEWHCLHVGMQLVACQLFRGQLRLILQSQLKQS